MITGLHVGEFVMMTGLHVGRSFTGNLLEAHCPCGNAPCGLVDTDLVDVECVQHGMTPRTIRQMHRADECPGKKEE